MEDSNEGTFYPGPSIETILLSQILNFSPKGQAGSTTRAYTLDPEPYSLHAQDFLPPHIDVKWSTNHTLVVNNVITEPKISEFSEYPQQ